MSFRVTQSMMNTQLIRNLNNNMRRLDHLQNQLNTGMKLNRPSDDPVGITYSLRYRSELSINNQYQRNVETALSWMDYTDTALNQIGDILHRANELALRAANGTNPPAAMDAIKGEIDELYSQLVDIGNSQINGKYIFNGQKTDIAPYDMSNAMTATTDNYPIQFEISAGIVVPVNLSGNDVFGPPGDTTNAFQILKDLSLALENNDHSGAQAAADKIKERMDGLLGQRSEIGAKVNRVELIESRLKDMNLNISELQSKVEDADMAELFIRLKMDENVYQASLSAGARIIRPSLVDFLR